MSGNIRLGMMNILLTSLGSEDWDLRFFAADALIQSGNVNPEVVNILLSFLGYQYFDIHYQNFLALFQIAKKTSVTIHPEVLQWLEQHPNHEGIGDAIDCLWSIVVE
jgi:uncharacterized membrane protein YqaE (UPF0057 family)